MKGAKPELGLAQAVSYHHRFKCASVTLMASVIRIRRTDRERHPTYVDRDVSRDILTTNGATGYLLCNISLQQLRSFESG
jgi:hypothetical protein